MYKPKPRGFLVKTPLFLPAFLPLFLWSFVILLFCAGTCFVSFAKQEVTIEVKQPVVLQQTSQPDNAQLNPSTQSTQSNQLNQPDQPVQPKPNMSKAVKEAIQTLSMELMEKFIEPTKLVAQKKQIQQIISTRYNRYILYTKVATPAKLETVVADESHCKKNNPSSTTLCLSPNGQNDTHFVIPITIGFSEENLKQILLSEDLFYSGEFNQRILPLVFFKDQVQGVSYAWWSKKWSKKNQKGQATSHFVKQFVQQFYDNIQKELLFYGFYLVNTEFVEGVHFIPQQLRFNKRRQSAVYHLARFFKAPLVLIGQVKVKESDTNELLDLKIALGVYHAKNGRLLAEIERLEKLPINENAKSKSALSVLPVFLKKNKHFSKGLGLQLRSIYDTGRLSSQVVSIRVQGYLTYQQFQDLKKQIVLNVKSVQKLQESLIRDKSITFKAQTTKTLEEVAKEVKKNYFTNFSTVVSHNRREILIRANPK